MSLFCLSSSCLRFFSAKSFAFGSVELEELDDDVLEELDECFLCCLDFFAFFDFFDFFFFLSFLPFLLFLTFFALLVSQEVAPSLWAPRRRRRQLVPQQAPPPPANQQSEESVLRGLSGCDAPGPSSESPAGESAARTACAPYCEGSTDMYRQQRDVFHDPRAQTYP